MTKDETELAPVDMVEQALQEEHRRRLLIRFIDAATALGFNEKQINNMVRTIPRGVHTTPSR